MISKNKIKYIRSLELKKFRKANGVFVAEGHKLVGDLLNVFECEYLAATSDWLQGHAEWIERQRYRGLEMDEVTEEELWAEPCKSFLLESEGCGGPGFSGAVMPEGAGRLLDGVGT